MAQFLTTQAISSELMSLIKDAKEKIILVSYSFKVNPQIQERLKTKSKLGTLSEIVIVYGRTELKQSELEWIQDIQDLKIVEKVDLHAKCYLNEHRAIICSMNLYDYSQQNNIEMGILITKEADPKAYEDLVEEINHIKVNGVRKTLDTLLKKEIKPTTTPLTKSDTPTSQQTVAPVVKNIELTNEQKLKVQVLKRWRLHKSKDEKCSAFLILTDEEIKTIVTKEKLDGNVLADILPNKKAKKYGDEIIYEMHHIGNYTIGKITNIWYQDDNASYDRVKLKILSTGEEKWFDTAKELPNKEKVVAVKLNKTWFNDFFYLDN